MRAKISVRGFPEQLNCEPAKSKKIETKPNHHKNV